jgi:hypothetical protein
VQSSGGGIGEKRARRVGQGWGRRRCVKSWRLQREKRKRKKEREKSKGEKSK